MVEKGTHRCHQGMKEVHSCHQGLKWAHRCHQGLKGAISNVGYLKSLNTPFLFLWLFWERLIFYPMSSRVENLDDPMSSRFAHAHGHTEANFHLPGCNHCDAMFPHGNGYVHTFVS
uniref:Uncharacterized protein n=1 Tax=Cacopsylla melanoneura TaxID=428564 RepID=A0A8D8UT02_9HEMI